MILKFKKLNELAELPAYSTGGAVGLDVKSCLSEPVTVQPMSMSVIPTGLSCELQDSWELQVRSRSGLAVSKQVFVLNSPGTIDPDYRGEIKVILFNLGTEPFVVNHGMKIAQLVAGPYPKMIPMEVVEVSETHRGSAGFGSTGV